jgi:hypothetical protein
MVTMSVNIRGAKELERNLGNPNAVRLPVRRYLLRGRDHLVPRIKRRIRRRTGVGRGSIQSELDTARVPRFVKIFSKEFYVRIYEYGAPGHGQKARKPFRGTLRRSKKVIFTFANDAGKEIARIIAKGR